jgi:hypothetical protein
MGVITALDKSEGSEKKAAAAGSPTRRIRINRTIM